VRAYTSLTALQPRTSTGYFPNNRGLPDVAALVRARRRIDACG
jgi:hypothetical protein